MEDLLQEKHNKNHDSFLINEGTISLAEHSDIYNTSYPESYLISQMEKCLFSKDPHAVLDDIVLMNKIDEKEVFYVVSDDYEYKRNAYYQIINLENQQKMVFPSSKMILNIENHLICGRVLEFAGVHSVSQKINVRIDEDVFYKPVKFPIVISSVDGMRLQKESYRYKVLKNSQELKMALKMRNIDIGHLFLEVSLPKNTIIQKKRLIFGHYYGIDPITNEIQSVLKTIYTLYTFPSLDIHYIVLNGEMYIVGINAIKFAQLSEEEQKFFQTIVSLELEA